MRKRLLAAAVLAFGAGEASAGEHYYFYKAGVSRDVFKSEETECEELATGVRAANIYQPPAQNMYAAGAGGFVSGFMRSRDRRRKSDAVVRTCMNDKGYSRIGTTADVIKQVNRLKGEERVDRMAQMAGAPTPDGEVLPP